MRYATAISLALVLANAQAADDTKASPGATSPNTQPSEPMSGKQKATAIGATTGAVAGAGKFNSHRW